MNRSRALSLVGVFLVAVTARVGFVVARGPQVQADTRSYELIATNLIHHAAFSMQTSEPFTPTTRRPPGYPWFLAGIFAAGGASRYSVVFLQAAISAVGCVVLTLFAGRLLPWAWAVGTGVFYALHPGEIVGAASMLSESLCTALLLAGAWLTVVGVSDRKPVAALAGGAFVGLSALVRTIVLPLTVLVPTVLWWQARRQRPTRQILLAVLAAAIVVVPWIWRSSALAGRFVLIQSAGGYNFYVTTRYDLARGAPDPALGQARNGVAIQAEFDKGAPHTTAQEDSALAEAAFEKIRRHPAAYLESRLWELPNLFLSSFDDVTGVYPSFARLRDLGRWDLIACRAGLLVFFCLAPLCLAAASLFLREARASAAWAAGTAVWAYLLLVHLPLWADYRFWLPAVPAMLLGAAAGARGLTNRRRATPG
jgi:4-amino-4-deoxy-L-arabinose transferase-like glycosyltransferase